MKSFSEMSLKPELAEAIGRVGFTAATEVQERSIPSILLGRDVIVRAKTGTGKTAAFIIPIMQRITHSGSVSAIIIVPTRELALQVAEFSRKLGEHMRLRTTTVYGGASINVQTSELERGTDIVVGTPGRIIDLLDRGVLRLDSVKFVVLDEADRMLDMGFIEDIDYILYKTPMKRQTMLFSATMPQEIVKIAKRHMDQGVETILVGEDDELVVSTISHSCAFANGNAKFASLLWYIDKFKPKKCIVFSRTQRWAELIHDVLRNNGYNAVLLHGGLTQAVRERSLSHFRHAGEILVATNIASRGLDINDVTDIVNFDTPETSYDYIHRVGRSARMGKEGRAFTIFRFDEKWIKDDIEYGANIKFEELRPELSKYQNVRPPERAREPFGGRGGPGGQRWHRGNQQYGRGEHRDYRGGRFHRGGQQHGHQGQHGRQQYHRPQAQAQA